MHFAFKAGLAAGSILVAGAAAHHVFAADAPAAVVQTQGPVIPPALEAQIRAMVRAHAPAGQADAAEAEAMARIQAHFDQIAKDPAIVAQANQVMAAAAAGDKDALEHIHLMLMQIVGGGDAHH